MIELVIAITVGGLLVAIATGSMRPALDQYAVRSAKSNFIAVHARARAHAIERGTRVMFNVDMASDSIWVSRGAATVESLGFARNNVVLRSDVATIALCMTARGYAETSCNNFTEGVRVRFSRGSSSDEVTILPLGQVRF